MFEDELRTPGFVNRTKLKAYLDNFVASVPGADDRLTKTGLI